MNTRGWLGEMKELLSVLRHAEALRDEDGRFVVLGEPILEGLTGDIVVSEGCFCLVQGKKVELLELLSSSPSGTHLLVIGGGAT